MKPLSLRLRNFRSHQETDFVFPEGASVIVGGNGEGKSSILLGAFVALFGGPLASYLKDDGASTEMLCEFVFEHDGETYRVRRGYSARGGGKSALDLDQLDCAVVNREDDPNYDEWFPLTRGNQRETQAAIEQVVGVSRETLSASAFAAQGSMLDWCGSTARDAQRRKETLFQILGLDQYAALERVARDKAAASSSEVLRLSTLIDQAEQELAERSLYQSELDTSMALRSANTLALEEARKQLAIVDEAVARWRESQASIETLREAHRSAQARLESARTREASLSQRIGVLRERLAGRDGLVDLAAALEERARAYQEALESSEAAREQGRKYDEAWREEAARKDAMSRATRERNRCEMEHTEAVERVAAMSKPGAECALCGQPVHGEHHAGALDKLQRIREDKTRILEAAIEAQNAAEHAHGDALSIALSITAPGPTADPAAAEQRWRESRDAKTALEALADADADLNVAMRDHAAACREVLSASEEAATLKWRIDAAKPTDPPDRQPAAQRVAELERAGATIAADITTARTHLQRLADLAERTQRHQAELDEAQDTRDTHLALARAYSRDGIPTLILENTAIPLIESEANRVLATLDSPHTIELRTQRALKSRDGVQEALDILVHTPAGTVREFESFSGGEETRIALALRIGLALMLAQSRNSDVQLFALDEPPGLDVAGGEALARLLHDLAADVFDCVILVSHDERMIDRFDQVTRVERASEGSVVSGVESIGVAA